MKSLPSHLFRSGAILSPSSLRRAHEGIRRDLKHVTERRHVHPAFTFPLLAITNASGAGMKERLFKPPRAIEITGIEFEIAGDDSGGGETTFTLSATGIDGWEDVTVTNSDGGTLVRTTNFTMRGTVAALQEVVFTVTGSTGTWTIDVGNIVVHYRHDRHAGQKPSTWGGPLAIKSGVATVAADVSGNFDNFDTDVTADGNNDSDLIVEVFTLHGHNGAMTVPSPAAGRSFHSVDAYGVDASCNCTVIVYDEGGFAKATATLILASTASTGKDQGVGTPEAQANDDPGDVNDDWDVYFGTSAACDLLYAVVYWYG